MSTTVTNPPKRPWLLLLSIAADGAILDGRCWYDPADNEPTELAAGHVTFRRDYMPPTPAERITHKTRVNIDYLKNLGKK